MTAKGLPGVLQQFRRVMGRTIPGASFSVKSYAGNFDLQQGDDGGAADYQTYSDYVLNSGLVYVMESRCAEREITETIREPDMAGRIGGFHRRIVQTIFNWVAKSDL